MWKYSISYPSIKNYLLQLSSQDVICPNGHIFKELFYSTICYISTIKDKLTCIYTWLIISSFSATWILTFLTPESKGVSFVSLFSLRFWNNNIIEWFIGCLWNVSWLQDWLYSALWESPGTPVCDSSTERLFHLQTLSTFGPAWRERREKDYWSMSDTLG